MSSFVRSIATTSCQSLDGFKTAHAYATPVAAIATRSDASDRHALSQVERDRTSRRREILSADDVPHRHHRRGAEIAVVQPRCASRLSGTVGIDVSTGQMAASSIQEQTRHALRNCTAILQAGGATLDDVVQFTVLLASPVDFTGMSAEYVKTFATETPTHRATVGSVAIASQICRKTAAMTMGGLPVPGRVMPNVHSVVNHS